MKSLNYYYIINEKDRRIILFIEAQFENITHISINKNILEIDTDSHISILEDISEIVAIHLKSKETDVVLIDADANFIGEFRIPILESSC